MREKALHRGLAVTRRAKTSHDTDLAYIHQKERELDAQIDQIDRELQVLTDQREELTRQRRWLIEKRRQVLDEQAAER